MNLSSLKNFAPAVRKQLIEAVGRKLDFVLTGDTPDLRALAPQVKALCLEAQSNRVGLIDRVAYTWFNRFAALRFLDARGWHPFRTRVLTPATPGETQPEILRATRDGALPPELTAFTNPSRLNDLLDGRIPSADPQGEVYRHLVLAACRFYHKLMPFLFEPLNDETELLLPDDLLTEHSVAHGFRSEIADEDCGDQERANVEILGWLYQFYISEKKDQVMARKSAVPTEDIPAVTQLFTPHWIVRYLVENSLGRLWLLNRPNSKLREQMPYYIEGDQETDFLKINKPEEIRLLDPASGSGHMLTYAFDLLALIYEEEGYAPADIPGLVLENNLHGVEICPRAAQLAELALVFKARGKSRRFFQADKLVKPQITALENVRFEERELRDYSQAFGLGDLFNQPMLKLLNQFEAATTFGSLIQPCLDEGAIVFARRAIEAKDQGGQLFLHGTHQKVLRVLEQAEALTRRYHVVVTNPPYMGSATMNPILKAHLKKHFVEGKQDTFGAFVQQSLQLLHRQGYVAAITIPNWMFLGSFEKFRLRLLRETTFISLLDNGRGVFGSDFGSCAFVISSRAPGRTKTVFRRLFRREGEVQYIQEIERNFFDNQVHQEYRRSLVDLLSIPGAPIAYWASAQVKALFTDSGRLKDSADPQVGLQTSDNERFLRVWHEVHLSQLALECDSNAAAVRSGRKWFPHNKGGAVRKWYGNRELIVNWKDDGKEIKEYVDSRYPYLKGNIDYVIKDRGFFFREGVAWSHSTASFFSARYSPVGAISNVEGPTLFAAEPFYFLGLLNSAPASLLMSILNPALHFLVGTVRELPIPSKSDREKIKVCVSSAVSIARADWDNFETSWDFRDLPLLRSELKGATLASSWQNWKTHCDYAVRRMQELETENNRLFIAAYGLQDELAPEVPEDQITLARADVRKDTAAFLSYVTGCIMGRYSLDHPGLILANAGDSLPEFLAKLQKPLDALTFAPDEDGIIPILDSEWFEDDIVARTREFLRATFGDATLEENLRFIEESLGRDLRKYFLTDFYKDHLQTYKKRPIYWMFSSPKKSFNALVYLHRYTKDTANTVLNRYLREFLHKLRSRIEHLEHALESESVSARDKTAARKEIDKLKKSQRDCEEYEREILLPLAQQRVELDLDDGVKVNYLKLGKALVPIAGLADKEEE